MFSRACEYAIKIMMFIATKEQEGKRTGLKEVTEAIGSPEAFTAKVLQQLVKAKLLKSYKGPTGGFELVKDEEVKLLDIVIAIDGSSILDECILGLSVCSSSNPCPVHDQFAVIKELLEDTLLSINLRNEKLLSKSLNLK